MRALALTSILFAACTNNRTDAPTGPTFASVHDRLAAESTRLFINGEGSSGSLDAKRYTSDGWVDGTSAISISSGDLIVKLTGDQLSAQMFDLSIGPIDLPDSLFGQPAQLTDVRVTLASSASATATWTDSDDATATIPLKLDLGWSISINGGVSQLGAQHLPVIPLDVTLTGAGDHVDAALGLRGDGTLWSWAGLIELSQLELSLAGATVD
ncbi:MAG TPA: hypothetical protein VF403_25945 [Kofleriaceae bacterium]